MLPPTAAHAEYEDEDATCRAAVASAVTLSRDHDADAEVAACESWYTDRATVSLPMVLSPGEE